MEVCPHHVLLPSASPKAVMCKVLRVTDPFEDQIKVLDPFFPKGTFAHNCTYNIRASLDPLKPSHGIQVKNFCHSKSLLDLVLLGAGFGFGDLRSHTQVPAMGCGPSQLMAWFLQLRNPGIALSFVTSLHSELSKMACDSQHLYLCRVWQGLSFGERQ